MKVGFVAVACVLALAACSSQEGGDSPIQPQFGSPNVSPQAGAPSFASLQPLKLTLTDATLISRLNNGDKVVLQNGQLVSSTDNVTPYCWMKLTSGFVASLTRYDVDNGLLDRNYLGGQQINFTVAGLLAVQCFKIPAGSFALVDVNGPLGALGSFGN